MIWFLPAWLILGQRKLEFQLEFLSLLPSFLQLEVKLQMCKHSNRGQDTTQRSGCSDGSRDVVSEVLPPWLLRLKGFMSLVSYLHLSLEHGVRCNISGGSLLAATGGSLGWRGCLAAALPRVELQWQPSLYGWGCLIGFWVLLQWHMILKLLLHPPGLRSHFNQGHRCIRETFHWGVSARNVEPQCLAFAHYAAHCSAEAAVQMLEIVVAHTVLGVQSLWLWFIWVFFIIYLFFCWIFSNRFGTFRRNTWIISLTCPEGLSARRN